MCHILVGPSHTTHYPVSENRASLQSVVRRFAVFAVFCLCTGQPITQPAEAAPPTQYLLQDHQLRIAVRLAEVKSHIPHLVGNSYGMALEGPSCGRPSLKLLIPTEPPPSLRSFGQLLPSGSYQATLALQFSARAELGTPCLGFSAVQGSVNLDTTVGAIPDNNVAVLNGNLTLFAFFTSWFKNDLQLPIVLDKAINVALVNQGQYSLDFGSWNGQWVSSGNSKSISFATRNYGSFGGNENETDFLVLDANIDSPKMLSFPTADQARKALAQDQPIQNGDNIGISARWSLLGARSADGTVHSGLLGSLLPMRLVGIKEASVLFLKRFYKYELVFDSASVTPGADGKSAVVTLGIGHASVTRVDLVSGVYQPVGGEKFTTHVSAQLTLGAPTLANSKVKFPISAFSVRVGLLDALVVPVSLSQDLSEKVIEGDGFTVGDLTSTPFLLLPDCILMPDQQEFATTARYGTCGYPGELFKALNRNDGADSASPGIRLDADFSNARITFSPDGLQASARIGVSDAARVLQPVNVYANGKRTPLLAIRYRATELVGQRQCGGIGGDQFVPLDEWSEKFAIDTNSNPGGCEISFGLIDPLNTLDGLHLSARLFPKGVDRRQCGFNTGTYEIPRRVGFVAQSADVPWTLPMEFNTDYTNGACYFEMSLSGRSDVELQLEFLPDGAHAENCVGESPPLVANTNRGIRLQIATNDFGGCTMRFKLIQRRAPETKPLTPST